MSELTGTDSPNIPSREYKRIPSNTFQWERFLGTRAGQVIYQIALGDGTKANYHNLGFNWSDLPTLTPSWRKELETYAILPEPQAHHFIQILGIVIEMNEVGYLTPSLPFCTLHDTLQSEKEWKYLDRWEVCFQACQALCYLHDHNLTHGDFQSQYLVFDDSGQTKQWILTLAHFRPGTSLMDGTNFAPHWQAPERVGQSNVTLHPKMDVWSFGCFLIEMWAKTTRNHYVMPWRYQQDIPNQLGKGIRPPETKYIIYPEMQLLAEACLHLDPEKRPTMKQVQACIVAQRKISVQTLGNILPSKHV